MEKYPNGKHTILWISRTAMFLALLVVLQAATASLGNTLITGTAVNMLLIVSVMTCGKMSGTMVAVLSPILAKGLGIGPLWSLIPFIIVGNILLVLLWHVIANRRSWPPLAAEIAALAAGALAKFLVLYVGIVKLAVPLWLGLTGTQAELISGMFSIPQLITAIFGGIAALLLLAPLKKALARRDMNGI